jgi:hypothetical protein
MEMTNPSKQKGTAAETALLRWLHANSHSEAVRNPPAGSLDVGDIRCSHYPRPGEHIWPEPIVVEVKNHRNLATAINLGIAELDQEMVNAKAEHGVLVVKRYGKADPGEWLAIRKVRNDPEIGAA